MTVAHTFHVSCDGAASIKLTATKPHKPFGRAILQNFLTAHNGRLGSALQLDCIVRCVVDGNVVSDLFAPIQSLFVGDATAHTVELYTAAGVRKSLKERSEPAPASRSAEAAPQYTGYSYGPPKPPTASPPPKQPPASPKASPTATPSAKPASTKQRVAAPAAAHRPNVRRLLRRLMRSDGGSCGALLTEVGELWGAHGWMPARDAVRSGVHWHLGHDQLRAMRRSADAKDLCASYEREGMYPRLYVPHTSSAPAGSAGHALTAARTVPVVECQGASSPLPDHAQALLGHGMCCVLRGVELWPRAEARWGKREYLRRELSEVSCQVLVSPKRENNFSYCREHRYATTREANKFCTYCTYPGYAFEPPKVEHTLMDVEDFFALSKKHAGVRRASRRAAS